jgi:hypothetical protein
MRVVTNPTIPAIVREAVFEDTIRTTEMQAAANATKNNFALAAIDHTIPAAPMNKEALRHRTINCGTFQKKHDCRK